MVLTAFDCAMLVPGLSQPRAVFSPSINGVLYAPFVSRGDNNARCPRTACVVDLSDGSFLHFHHGQASGLDETTFQLKCRRTTIAGQTITVGESVVVAALNTSDAGTYYLTNVVACQDASTGRVWLLYERVVDATRAIDKIYRTYSDDLGATWASPTEVQSSLVVVDGSTPSGHPFESTAWFSVFNGNHQGLQLQYQTGATAGLNGQILFPFYHRQTDNTTPSYAHVVRLDPTNSGAVSLHGGLIEDTANEHTNEWWMMERTNGTLYGNCRYNNGSPRKEFTSTDGGVTWTNAANSAIAAHPVAGACRRLSGDIWVAAVASFVVNSTNPRKRMGVVYTTDGGVNWSSPFYVSERWSAYCGIHRISNAEFLLIYERGMGGTGATAGDADTTYADHQGVVRLSMKTLQDRPPLSAELRFDERAAGKPCIFGGPSIQDYSGHAHNAEPVSADNGLAYVEVSGERGIRLDGTNDYLILEDDNLYFNQPTANERFYFEAKIKTASANCVLYKTNKQTLEIASGVLKYTCADGTHTPVATGSTAVNTDAKVTVGFYRDGTNIGVLVEGVSDGSTADTTWGTTLAHDSSEARFGADLSGNNKLAGDVFWIRQTKGSAPSSYRTSSYSKPAPATWPSYAGQPSALASGCKLHIQSPNVPYWYGERNASYRCQYPYTRYQGLMGVRDLAGDVWAYAQATSRTMYADYHASVGPHTVHPAPSAAAAAGLIVARREQTFQFHQTCTFTFSAFVKTTSASVQILCDNCDFGNRIGWGINLTSTLQVRVFLDDNTTFKTSTSTGVITTDTWWHILLIGNGFGNSLTLYLTQASASSLASPENMSSMSAYGVTPADANEDLYVAGRSGQSGGGSIGASALLGSLVDFTLWDNAIAGGVRQSAFDWTKNHASRVLA